MNPVSHLSYTRKYRVAGDDTVTTRSRFSRARHRSRTSTECICVPHTKSFCGYITKRGHRQRDGSFLGEAVFGCDTVCVRQCLGAAVFRCDGRSGVWRPHALGG